MYIGFEKASTACTGVRIWYFETHLSCFTIKINTHLSMQKTNQSLLMADRKQFFDKLEQRLYESGNPDDSLFYYHPSEDHIVLSHALLWMMSAPVAAKLRDNRQLLLLRQYEEEMLVAYLTEDERFTELLRYSNILCDIFPQTIPLYANDAKNKKLIHRLMSTIVVACGYAGDLDTEEVYTLLDDLDFDSYGKVYSSKIANKFPALDKMVVDEMK